MADKNHPWDCAKPPISEEILKEHLDAALEQDDPEKILLALSDIGEALDLSARQCK